MNINIVVLGRKHHSCDDPWAEAPAWVIELILRLDLNRQLLEAIMADVKQVSDDFNAFAQAVNDYIAAVNAALATAQQNTTDQAALQTLDDTIKSAGQTLASAASGLNNAPATPVDPSGGTLQRKGKEK